MTTAWRRSGSHPSGDREGPLAAVGVGIIVLGVLICVASAFVLGRGLLGLGVIVAGLVMLFVSQGMSRRTPTGSEALRRVLGFRLYVATAETRIQDFNERQNILTSFAKYLPYATSSAAWTSGQTPQRPENEAQASTAGWYTGVAPSRARLQQRPPRVLEPVPPRSRARRPVPARGLRVLGREGRVVVAVGWRRSGEPSSPLGLCVRGAVVNGVKGHSLRGEPAGRCSSVRLRNGLPTRMADQHPATPATFVL
jgi:hypothetical protein